MEKKYKVLITQIKDLSVETPNAETLMLVKDHISNSSFKY